MAKRGKKTDGTSFPAAVGMGLRACARTLARALPMVLLTAGVSLGGVTLWRAALRDERFVVGGETISLTGAARFSREARAEVERLAAVTAGRSLLDPRLLADVRRAYEQSPWIKRVCAVRREFPNRVAVEFVLRVPAAQVRRNGWYWLVDAEGVLLRVAASPTPRPGLPEITGTTPGIFSSQPAYGRVWRDQAVLDALGALRAIQDSPLSEDLHVTRVLVHRGSFLDSLACRRRQRPRLDLQTREGVLIRWGTNSSGDLPHEVPAREKIGMLRAMLTREFVVPGICLDVRTRVPGFSLPEQ